MSEASLFDLVNEVEDETTFLNFMSELLKDRIKFKNTDIDEEWKNSTIEDFLECALEWGEASKNRLEYYRKPDNPWKRCAQILYMGKVYE